MSFFPCWCFTRVRVRLVHTKHGTAFWSVPRCLKSTRVFTPSLKILYGRCWLKSASPREQLWRVFSPTLSFVNTWESFEFFIGWSWTLFREHEYICPSWTLERVSKKKVFILSSPWTLERVLKKLFSPTLSFVNTWTSLEKIYICCSWTVWRVSEKSFYPFFPVNTWVMEKLFVQHCPSWTLERVLKKFIYLSFVNSLKSFEKKFWWHTPSVHGKVFPCTSAEPRLKPPSGCTQSHAVRIRFQFESKQSLLEFGKDFARCFVALLGAANCVWVR